MMMKKLCINLIMILCLFTGFIACSDDESDVQTNTEEPDPTDPTDPVDPTDSFAGPSYADNYTNIAGWANRSQWNLANVHDPTVVKQGDYFYMYQTNASYGNAHEGNGHFHARRSTDLVNWEYMGATMNQAPDWIREKLNEKRAAEGRPPILNPNYGYWAPAVVQVGNVYRMYYSIVILDLIEGNDNCASWNEESYIGLMESTDLASNQWEDKGMVISQISDGIEDLYRDSCNDWSAYYKFNAIDPSVIVTPEGENWMIYGSWHTGIAAVELDPSTGKPFQLNTEEDYGVRVAGRGNINANRWQGLEAPEVVYNPDTGYYYLFLAYDELSVAYNTRVARSTNILGPYEGIDGQNVSNGAEAWPMLTHPYQFNSHTGWVGISHCAIFQDPDNGKWYYSSQGRLPENVPGINASNAVMMGHVREVEWTSDGWPVVAPQRYAGVPDLEITEEDIVGIWEQITMEYQYQVMQTSENVVFNANGTLGGSMGGTWSFDESTRTLTINGNECKLLNAWDWEASPRRRTITYSGLTETGRPIWAKKRP
jgi:arabinan endo-1,5-alpha-L-arabinosidase